MKIRVVNRGAINAMKRACAFTSASSGKPWVLGTWAMICRAGAAGEDRAGRAGGRLPQPPAPAARVPARRAGQVAPAVPHVHGLPAVDQARALHPGLLGPDRQAGGSLCSPIAVLSAATQSVLLGWSTTHVSLPHTRKLCAHLGGVVLRVSQDCCPRLIESQLLRVMAVCR